METKIQYLTKPCVLIWNKKTKMINAKITDNKQAWTSAENGVAEFDSEKELNNYVLENNLSE